MKKRLSAVLMILAVFCAAALPVSSARALTVNTGMITADGVALRRTASEKGVLMTRLSEGTIVKILETNVNSEWYHVEAGTRTGYVNRMYVNIDASLPSYQLSYSGTIVNVQNDVNVRAEPSARAKKLGTANKGQTFTVTQAYASGAWHAIDYNGATGYVSADYVELKAVVGKEYLSDIEVTGGSLSPKFSPTEFGYVLTATQGEVQIKAVANSGVKVSIGNTGIASAKYTINSGNSKTIRISVGGKVKYSIYLVRDVLTVGTWNIKRGNDSLVMQGWLIAAQRPDILGVQEVYLNKKEGTDNLLSVRTRNAQYTSFAETISYSSGGQYGIGQVSKFKPENETVTLLPSEDKEQRCLQKVEYVIDGKRVSVYNTHFSFESATIRKKQFATVLSVMNADQNTYKILTGDFNAKESEFSGFLKNYRVVNTSATKFYDYSYSRISMSQIDNIIVSKNITVLNARAIPTEYSDHYPLFAFLALK
ncbi:MAG: SH3 domain-containing protein [Clostridiales bacterium]|nr:SH3 domain-containing protein [Clostridiales bacterium]